MRILREHHTPTRTIELAERIGSYGDENPSPERIRTVYLDLYHNHLPGLEEADVVAYDPDLGTVRRGANFGLLARTLRELNHGGVVSPEEAPQGGGYATGRWIEFFLRTSAPAVVGERVNAVLDRLGELRDDGAISGYAVRQWPPRDSARVPSERMILPSPTRRDLVAEFDAWAEEHGYSLRPAFGSRFGATLGTGEDERTGEDEYEYYAVPLMTLAFYEEGTLTGVVPCADGQRTYTIPDFLSARDPVNFPGLTN